MLQLLRGGGVVTIDPDLMPVQPASLLHTPDLGDADSKPPDEFIPPPTGTGIWTPDPETLMAAGLRPALPRVCHAGCIGPDVIAYKRALRSSGSRPANEGTNNSFGQRFAGEVERFQGNHNLDKTGVIGGHTYAAMFPFFGAYERWLIRKAASMLPGTVTHQIVTHALRSVAMAFAWHYAQIRPYPVGEAPDHTPTTTDCSGHAGLMRHWSGASSPFGSLGWSGYGNTDVMLQNGTEIPEGQLQPGDLVLYANPGHVATIIKWPMVVSFGSEAAPFYMDGRYRIPVAFRRYE